MSGLYAAYDFICRCDVALPELREAFGPPDVEITVEAIQWRPRQGNSEGAAVEIADGAVWLFHGSVGAFRIADGRTIAVDPAPDVDPALLRTFLLGPAMGILLRQRGHLTLHGSAVLFGQGAVLFLGISGAGKSTTAAVLRARGCPVIADDVIAIDSRGPQLLTFPASSGLKLDDNSATYAKLPTSENAEVDHKRSYSTDRLMAPGPIPVTQVFVLATAEQPALEPLSPPDALPEVLRHSYGARSLQSLHPERHFQQCATLAGRVPVSRLTRSAAFTDLAALIGLVEHHLAPSTP